MEQRKNTEPFPSLSQPPSTNSSPGGPPIEQMAESTVKPRARESRKSNSSGGAIRRQTASLGQSFLNSNPPYGMWQATGEVASKAPTLGEIKDGSFCAEGWTEEGQMEKRGQTPHQIQRRKTSRSSQSTSGRRMSATSPLSARAELREEPMPTMNRQVSNDAKGVPSTIPEPSRMDAERANRLSHRVLDETPTDATTTEPAQNSPSTSDKAFSEPKSRIGPDETGTYPNGYRFPPKHTWWQSTVIGLKAFWKFFLTPFGFLITIYGLNVVAWGAMIFFVLLNAAPAMCHPSCDDDQSARKIWIEIDSQILNALFCVTGFGLIPWRFRDFYYLIQWRVFKKFDYFRRLAGHNRGWFRLPGSDKIDELLAPPPVYNKKNPKQDDSPPEWTDGEIAKLERNPAVPLPATSMPTAPLTGVRAPPTKPVLIDVVVWMYILNTVFQACLAGAMWGLNRFTRPGWVTGFLVSMACIVGIVAGLVVFVEGKKIKKIEGIPVEEKEVEEDVEKDQEAWGLEKGRKGAVHENNEGRTHETIDGRVIVNDDFAEEPPILTRKKTEKTKGRHWYERH